MPQAKNDSRVEWIIPSSSRPKNKDFSQKNGKSTQNHSQSTSNQDDCRSNSSLGDADFNRFTVLDPSLDNENGHHTETIDISVSICRTICMIVGEHLKELKSHQSSINKARLELVRNVPQDSNDENYIAHNDVYKLKVRDEQTKAIETIKQLTNYLRELTLLKKQIESSKNSIEEDVSNKLFDVRSDIIQSLNDFVLSNGDIDVPIIDPEDSNTRGYDLCFDAKQSRDYSDLEILDPNDKHNETNVPNSGVLNQTPELTTNENKQFTDKSIQIQIETQESQVLGAEKRRKDIEKLEKDTVELRRLFEDFYNLVKTQGEQVDKIEDHIVVAAQHISEGKHHLTRAVKSFTVLVPVTGCIAGAIIGGPIGFALGGKVGGASVVCASSLIGLLSTIGVRRCIVPSKLKDE